MHAVIEKMSHIIEIDEDMMVEVDEKNEEGVDQLKNDEEAVGAVQKIYSLVGKCEDEAKQILAMYRMCWWVQLATVPVKALGAILVMLGTMLPSPIISPIMKTVGGGCVLASELANPVARLNDVTEIKDELDEVLEEVRGIKRKLEEDEEERENKKKKTSISTQTDLPDHLRKCEICCEVFWRQNLQNHMITKHA